MLIINVSNSDLARLYHYRQDNVTEADPIANSFRLVNGAQRVKQQVQDDENILVVRHCNNPGSQTTPVNINHRDKRDGIVRTYQAAAKLGKGLERKIAMITVLHDPHGTTPEVPVKIRGSGLNLKQYKSDLSRLSSLRRPTSLIINNEDTGREQSAFDRPTNINIFTNQELVGEPDAPISPEFAAHLDKWISES